MSKFDKRTLEAGLRWKQNPAAMVRELFGTEPDLWQTQVLEDFPKYPMQAMLACKGPGKTTVLAWLAWNFLLTRHNPNIAATSISGDNLRDGLVKEMAKWHAKLPGPIGAAFVVTTTRIFAKQAEKNWFMSFRTWPKTGNAQAQADTLAGLHEDNVMFIIDESGGVPVAVMATAEAALSSCVEGHILQAGNPTTLDGALYAAWRDRVENGGDWRMYEVTGDPDAPNRSPRVTVEWARNQIRKYGVDNPWVLVNVFGRFPPASIMSLISEDEVLAAMSRYYRAHEIGDVPKILGVDVARQGLDESVISRRQGIQLFPFKGYRNVDGLAGAAITNREWQEFDADACFVDATGGFGFTWIDQLNVLGRSAIPVQFSGKASADDRYYNKRAEMYFELVRWIKNGGALPPKSEPGSNELLLALTKTQYTHKGERLILEDKDDIRDKLGFSPDHADAAALTFAEPVTLTRHTSRPQSRSAIGQAYDPFHDLDRRAGAAPAYNPFQFR